MSVDRAWSENMKKPKYDEKLFGWVLSVLADRETNLHVKASVICEVIEEERKRINTKLGEE